MVASRAVKMVDKRAVMTAASMDDMMVDLSVYWKAASRAAKKVGWMAATKVVSMVEMKVRYILQVYW